MTKGVTKVILAPLLIVAFIIVVAMVNNMWFDATQKFVIYVTAFLLVAFFMLYALWK